LGFVQPVFRLFCFVAASCFLLEATVFGCWLLFGWFGNCWFRFLFLGPDSGIVGLGLLVAGWNCSSLVSFSLALCFCLCPFAFYQVSCCCAWLRCLFFGFVVLFGWGVGYSVSDVRSVLGVVGFLDSCLFGVRVVLFCIGFVLLCVWLRCLVFGFGFLFCGWILDCLASVVGLLGGVWSLGSVGFGRLVFGLELLVFGCIVFVFGLLCFVSGSSVS